MRVDSVHRRRNRHRHSLAVVSVTTARMGNVSALAAMARIYPT
jgi:hypothetical protein